MLKFVKLSLLFFMVFTTIGYSQTTPAIVQVDLSKPLGEMRPIWAWFGYDEPNYTYMRDGKKLLGELAALSPVPVYVRTHNLLTTGDGKAELKWGSTNAYTEDKDGNPVYDWTIVDSIVDTYVKLKMKPLMEIGFMPEALSVKPKPYKHTWEANGQIWTGWTYPPNDYKKWEELVYQWVKHSIERYGREEVKSWHWELWNEPNIGYWSGTFDEFCKLYDYSAQAVKRACPDCTMGGPHTTNPNSPSAEKFLRDFLEHCATGKNYATGKIGSPLDFVAFHAKGNPSLVDGRIRMDMSPQLKAVEIGFKTIASFDAFKNLPVIIGECDPEGCAACSMQKQPQNGYRNGTMYSSYTAASYARIYDLAAEYKIHLAGAVTWAFEFENQKWFDGFRDLATNGVAKPVLNVFRMFGKMSGQRVEVQSDRMHGLSAAVNSSIRGPQPEIGALASKGAKTAAVMVWNYHDEDRQGASEPVRVLINNIPVKKFSLTHYRIDSENSNSYEVWKKMGSPQNPSAVQIKQLEDAGQLKTLGKTQKVKTKSGKYQLSIALPRQGISLLKLDWK